QWLRLRPEARRPERASADEEPAAGAGQSLRATPLVLLPRRHAGQWARLAPPADGEVAASPRALKVLAHLREHGASFFDEIADDTRLLRTELEDALAELVARGQVHCDSFGGLRSLLIPASRRAQAAGRRRRGAAF